MSAKGFDPPLTVVAAKIEQRAREVFLQSAIAIHNGVRFGDPVTGAPGQPVDTGNLRVSWQLAFQGPVEALITTNVDYAPAIEEGIGPYGMMRLKSAVGGFHSVALTRANWPRLVDHVVKQVVR